MRPVSVVRIVAEAARTAPLLGTVVSPLLNRGRDHRDGGVHLGELHFGLIACRELVPDVGKLTGYLVDELDLLSSYRNPTLPPLPGVCMASSSPTATLPTIRWSRDLLGVFRRPDELASALVGFGGR
jgi:hypothetical protein